MENQKQRIYDELNKMNIKYEAIEHEPVHTMEDMDRLGLPAKGTLCKNLFLRDAKGKRHFLVTADENAKVDLKALAEEKGLSVIETLELSCANWEGIPDYNLYVAYIELVVAD